MAAQDHLKDINAGLSKKGTFVAATKKLQELIQSGYAGASDSDKEHMFALCKRVMSLLKARYTAIGFWRLGKDLFDITAAAMEGDNKRMPTVRDWISAAVKEIDDIEGKDGGNTEADPNNHSSSVPSGQRAGNGNDNGELTDGDRHADIESFVNSLLTEGDLERLMSMMTAGGMPHSASTGPPPASREARFNLDMKSINEQGVICSICQENFKVNGKAKIMPCGHPFHYDCLMEWLERHNSCPTCRSELPTERPTMDLESDAVASRDPSRSGLYS